MTRILKISGKFCCHYYSDSSLHLSLTEVFSPDHFYIQLQENEADLDEFLRDLTEFYIQCEERQEPGLDSLRLAPTEVRVDQMVAVVWDVDHYWYRARVKKIVSIDRVEIQFIDYGTRAFCSKSQLYRLPDKFVHRPPAAICARLFNIMKTGVWSEQSLNRFQELVGGGLVIGERNTTVTVRGDFIEQVDNEKKMVQLFIEREGGEHENVADILVKEGFATYEHTRKVDKIHETVPFRPSIQEMLEDITVFLKIKRPVKATCKQEEALEKLKSDFNHLESLFKQRKVENVDSVLRFQMKVATDILLMAAETSDFFELYKDFKI